MELGYDPINDRQMNRQFATRLRSFLSGDKWWKIIQQLKEADVPAGSLWTHIAAGISDLSDEDILFAMSVKWDVERDIFVSNDIEIENYSGDWWYADLDDKDVANGASISVRGPVTLRNPYESSAAIERAMNFTNGVIEPRHWVGRIRPSAAETGRIVTGQIFLQ
jgi:hypothetical protein